MLLYATLIVFFKRLFLTVALTNEEIVILIGIGLRIIIFISWNDLIGLRIALRFHCLFIRLLCQVKSWSTFFFIRILSFLLCKNFLNFFVISYFKLFMCSIHVNLLNTWHFCIKIQHYLELLFLFDTGSWLICFFHNFLGTYYYY